ncbi:MAG: hypothetical protein ACYDIC_03415 [Desulfobaccales bacterium]
MAEQEVDLAKTITDLESKRKELEELWRHPPGENLEEKERKIREIEDMMACNDEKISSLKDILNNQQPSQIVIRGLTPEEKKQMNEALAALSIPIQRDQAFQVVMTTLTMIFQGIELIATKA